MIYMKNSFDDLNRIVDPLLEWYHANKRDLPWRINSDPYRVWVSEIMLQQTRVEPVIPYYLRFMETLPCVEALADVSEDGLMKLWEGLGYYSRARNLQKAAKIIVEKQAFPCDFEGWNELPGIGDYTAGAICSIALGLPTPAVDGNVLRVLSRIIGSYEDIALPATKKRFTEMLRGVYPAGHTSEFTQSLMELGAMICLPNGAPHCESCPLKSLCTAYNDDLIDSIPVKSEKKKRKKEKKTVLILRHENKVAIRRRGNKGLLAGLWEFPNLEGHLSEEELVTSFSFDSCRLLSSATHVFTHIEWDMIGYELVLNTCSEEYTWVTIDDLLLNKAIPSAFRVYVNLLNEIRYKEI